MLFSITVYSARIFLWLAGIVGCSLFPKLKGLYRLITIYLLLAIGIDVVNKFLQLSSGYNLFVLPIYSLIEFFIFSILYILFFLNKSTKWLVLFIIVVHGLIFLDIASLANLYNAKTFYAFSKVVADAGIILFCLFYYFKILKGKEKINKEMFTLNSIFIAYYSINIIIFLSINFLVNESKSIVDPFWILNAVSASLLYLSLTYMIWQHGKTQKTLPSGS